MTKDDFKVGTHFEIPRGSWEQYKVVTTKVSETRIWFDIYERQHKPSSMGEHDYPWETILALNPIIIGNPHIAASVVAPTGAVNTACGTCSEAFPYDALPSNRPDGKTDCSRCRILKGVFT